MSRESAINFLRGVVEEYGKTVLNPSQETEEYLVEEIKKVSLRTHYEIIVGTSLQLRTVPW